MVFTSQSVTDYTIINIDSSFEHQPLEPLRESLNHTTIAVIEQMIESVLRGNLDNLTNSKCIDEYHTNFPTTRHNVLLVSELIPTQPYWPEVIFKEWNAGESGFEMFDWMCRSGSDSPPDKNCETRLKDIRKDLDDWKPWGFPIKYCLSESMPQACRLNFNSSFGAAVVVSNLIKLGAFLYLAVHITEEPFFVLGDAIQSFLVFPEPQSKRNCLASCDDFKDLLGTRLTRLLSRGATRRRRWSSLSATQILVGLPL